MQRVSRSEMCGVVPHDHRDEAQLWTHLGSPCWPCLPPVPAFPYQSPPSRHRGGDHQTFERWMMDFHLPKLGDGLSTAKNSWELKLSLFPNNAWVMYLLGSLVVVGKPTLGHENNKLWEPSFGTTEKVLRLGSSKRKSSLFR